MSSLRIAHLSDLHFGYVTKSLTQFLSKRWIGNLNLLLFRRRSYKSDHFLYLPKLLKSLKVDSICFTGDFTATSLPEEFQLAKTFLSSFSIPYFTLPGNHDCYTKQSEKSQEFYRFFPPKNGILGHNLGTDRVFCTQIKDNFFWLALDCAVATPPFNAYGIFTEEMREKTEAILTSLSPKDQIIMGCHFPLFSSNRPTHELKNSEKLRDLLKKWPQIKVYLHGHDHKPYIIDKRKEGLPLVLNSGCSAIQENGGFYLIDFSDKAYHVQHFFYKEEKGWYPEVNYTYSL